MKIKYLLTSYTCGGAEMGALRILKELASIYDIELLVLEDKGELKKEFNKVVPCKCFDITNKLNPFKMLELVRYLKKEKPDLVIASLFHPVIFTRLFKPFLGYKLITWEHSIDFGNKLRKWLKRITQGLSNLIIGDSNAVCDILKKEFNLSKDKVKMVPIGCVDLNKFKPRKRKKNKIIKIGCVGRLDEPKGYEYLIEAIKLLTESTTDFVVEIVGDGKLFESLLRQVDRLGLHNHIKFLGYRKDIHKIMPTWDIYVQPSLWEGQCMTVVEATACGLPIVASNVGGIPDTVIHDCNGVLVKPKDITKLSGFLLVLIVGSDVRELFGENSRHIAESYYDKDRMIEKMKEVIETFK